MAFRCLLSASLAISLTAGHGHTVSVSGSEDERHLATRLNANLALGQPVTLSTTASYEEEDPYTKEKTGRVFVGDGWRATDGDMGNHFYYDGGCAETQATPDPWLRVDLGREVPVAVVRLITRVDSFETGVHPIEVYLGNNGLTWRENLQCAHDVLLSRSIQPNAINCFAAGRYLWVVLRAAGNNVLPLSVCEVEVTPKGPAGTRHVMQTIGGMWNLELDGILMSEDDRIRIVPDTVICGETGSSVMSEFVLGLTSPLGKRTRGTFSEEAWNDIQISRTGVYKVCWCGGVNFCNTDGDFALQVAVLIINGIMMTVAGTGYSPNRTADVVNGAAGLQTALADPYGVAVTATKAFFTEMDGHMIRYLDIESGITHILCGQFKAGLEGDGQPAYLAELNAPMGLALDPAQEFLYIADSGNNRVRKIDVTKKQTQQGIISTVAGNGYRGYSGDGGPAIEAQLNRPTGVAVDLNEMLWIADYANNVVRVVSMKIPVRIPGTNEFQANIILTAAGGGSTASSTDIGDGGVGWLAQVKTPVGLAVSQAFISNEEGSLPVSVYITEDTGQRVRDMTLDYQSYLGTISTLVGTGEKGSDLKESSPLEATNSQLNVPTGVAVNDGYVYVTDQANHRLLMLPALEYVSQGCWRENIDSPWIPSIEGKARPFGNDYLQGAPENRFDAITMCALAALQRGFTVFAVRQMGVCASSKDAHLYFRYEGSSTSCADGKGGARDNSVYRFARTGMMEEMQGLVYKLAGRDGQAGFSGDLGSAWVSDLRMPAGLAISPATKDIWIADLGNQRLRLIFAQMGPTAGHQLKCYNGFECEVEISGNGLQPGNELAIVPLNVECGTDGITFQHGIPLNPVKEVPSPSFTKKRYKFGTIKVERTGDFRLCFCTKDAVVFGEIIRCNAPEYFIQDAGIVSIVGADSRIKSQEVIEAMPGRPFDLAIDGHELSLFDKVSIVPMTQECGLPGAEVLAPELASLDAIQEDRVLGNTTFSLWANITLTSSGEYKVCWCQGSRQDGTKLPCASGQDFRLQTLNINVRGPKYYTGTIHIGGSEDVYVHGVDMAGFGAQDRIRLVDALTVQCASNVSHEFSEAIEFRADDAEVPAGPPTRISQNTEVWTNVKVRTSRPLRICWCGNPNGCVNGPDFMIDAGLLVPIGPRTEPANVVEAASNHTKFQLKISGSQFTGNERISIVDDFTRCGTIYSGQHSEMVYSKQPKAGPTQSYSDYIRWWPIEIEKKDMYRICYCYCSTGEDETCCLEGKDFYTDLGAVYVGQPERIPDYVATVWPKYNVEELELEYRVRPPPSGWGIIEQDKAREVTIRTKTRPADSHTHGKTTGPIIVRLLKTDDEIEVIAEFTLTNLHFALVNEITKEIMLDKPMRASAIQIESETHDAWECEWVEVSIGGYDGAGIAKRAMPPLGTHRFACHGWVVHSPEQEARRITMGIQQPPLLPTILPRPSVEIWKSRYFMLDPCGGCEIGWECAEEIVSMTDRLQREAELGLIYTARGVSNPEMAPYTVKRAVCKPLCGDGRAQVGEQCDDGNLRSLDGCSADCKVEHAFECANFNDMPSSCYPRICDNSPKGKFPSYSQTDLANVNSVGSTCDVSIPWELKADPAMPTVCYQWDYLGGGKTAALCPADKSDVTMKEYIFVPPDPVMVGCKSYKMEYLGHGMQCNYTNRWMVLEMVLNYESCALACELDGNCYAAMFHVNDPEGGKECPYALHCKGRCWHLDSCDEWPLRNGMNEWSYQVGKKIMKTTEELPVQRICSKVDPPKPAAAFEEGGVIVVTFGSFVEPPHGVSINEAFFCDEMLTESSQVAVGGKAAACILVIGNVLHIRLGPEASLARPDDFDNEGWIKGDTALLEFDQSKMVPRGMRKEMMGDVPAIGLPIMVRYKSPYQKIEADKPQLPEVIIRGPAIFGGCGDLEVVADVSSMSKGRRWKSAVWSCVTTRPQGSLPAETKNLMYDACKSVVNPVLKEKSWCGYDFDPDASPVVPACEMRVVIPSANWCGLSMVRLKATLTSFEGFVSSAEWETEISPLSRIPTAGAVGPSTIHLKPQKRSDELVKNMRLEVSTESDAKMIGKCTCDLAAAPSADGSESRVVVSWFYGEVVDGVVPRVFEMEQAADLDLNTAQNILEVALKGHIMKPNSEWRYVARVAYAVHDDVEAAFVPFTVYVGPLEPPQAYVAGPARVNNENCQFVLDARNSKVMEILYYMRRRLDEEVPQLPDHEPRELQGNTTSSVGVSSQQLTYKWSMRQLGEIVDDANKLKRNMPSAATSIMQLVRQTDPQFVVDQAMLPEGLYTFTVEVTDVLLSSLSSKATITVEVHKELLPALSAEGPAGPISMDSDVEVVFKQNGFGVDCIAPVGTTEGSNARTSIILMRGIVGQPRHHMRAIMEVPMEYKIKDMAGSIGNSVWFYGEVPVSTFEPGFLYQYRLMTAERKKGGKMAEMREALLAANDDSDVDDLRILNSQPREMAVGTHIVDAEPFGVHIGPVAGSLEVLAPVGGLGFAMTDLFKFQQTWASDNPPLMYAFYFARVPPSNRSMFEAEIKKSERDIFTDSRLKALLDPSEILVPLSDFSMKPSLATPLAQGMYVIEGRVRDGLGHEDRKYAVVEAYPVYQEDVITSRDRIQELENYIARSRQAILQVRAYNRGAISVVPVCAAVYALPNLYNYDFRSMIEWNASSTAPMPNLSQPIYGAPILSRETRKEVAGYLFDLMSVFGDIVEALDSEALGGALEDARRLEALDAELRDEALEAPASLPDERRLEGSKTTPNHVQAIAAAFVHLAENLAPIGETMLFVRLGQLVAGILERVRAARGDIRKAGDAPYNLVKTTAYLLATMEAIEKPREGILKTNVSELAQAQLSAAVVRSTGAMGDVLATTADVDGPDATINVEMPKAKYLSTVGGHLSVTIIKKSLTQMIENGVETTPDYQSMQRWVYPQMDIAGLGAPGFYGALWAGESGADVSADDIQCQSRYENYLQSVTVTAIAWPVNPFMYASGTLVSMDAEVTQPYTVQFRSCGVPVKLEGQTGKVRLTFRLSPDIVRDRRWGYGDTAPYRVAWWEDIEGVSDQADRIRRWTTLGCKTRWDKIQEDLVQATCDRLPTSTGAVFVVELVPRPVYELEGIPRSSRNFHNVITYMMLCFAIRWCILIVLAIRGDTNFWPSEKQLVKLTYLPHERKWRERIRRGRIPPREPITWNPFSGNFWYQTKMLWIDRIIWLFSAFKAMKGSELFMSVEVRELIKMRSGERDQTYERFVESMNEKDNLEKIEFVKEQRGIASQMALANMPDTMNRRAAWDSAAAIADSEVSYRNERQPSSAESIGLGAWNEPDKFEDGGPPQTFAQLRKTGDAEEQFEIEEAALRGGHAPGTGPTVSHVGNLQQVDQSKNEAALKSALYEGKVGGLPPGWEEFVSEEHGGRVFYVYSQTGDTTWERPTLMPDGTIQFFPHEGGSPTNPAVSSSELPELRGKGKRLGTLRSSSEAIHRIQDGEKTGPPTATLRTEAKHKAMPPPPKESDDEEEEDEVERTAVEQEREVPAHRRLPLFQQEVRHQAVPPQIALASVIGGDDDAPDSVREQVNRSLAAAARSQEVVLPSGWELHTTSDGREFYVNLGAGITQWQAPQLPPHWEERFSREGKVYYLSLFDGRTQWEWPQENQLSFQHRLEDIPAITGSASGLALALPGSTQEEPIPADDTMSETSTDTSVGAAMDQVDAHELLAVPPGGEGSILTPREDEAPERDQQVEKWGVDKLDQEWLDLKKSMGSMKKAHDERWLTARQFPGVREFVRPYELANQTNNWERAVDNVTLKIDNLEKAKGELGVEAELKREELRQIFPVIQRLLWTKNSGFELCMHCILREIPIMGAFANVARPSKTHRTILHIFSVLCTLMAATGVVAYEAPISEDIEATDRATWTLIEEAFTMPIAGNTLMFTLIGYAAGAFAKSTILSIFYAYKIPYNVPPTTSVEARKAQLRYWHELAEMGKWTCLVGSFMCFCGTISACMLMPQPRAAAAFQAFWLALILGHWLLPIIKGIICAEILISAREMTAYDGLLTVFPGLMDFASLGVKTTEFMVWRAQRMVAEEELLIQVFPDLPKVGRKVRDPSQEEVIPPPQDPNDITSADAIEDQY